MLYQVELSKNRNGFKGRLRLFYDDGRKKTIHKVKNKKSRTDVVTDIDQACETLGVFPTVYVDLSSGGARL